MNSQDKNSISYRGVTVRDADFPESYDEYLEIIYRISLKNPGGWVKNKEISNRLGVKAPSVSNMLEKLSEAELIDWTPRKGIRLSNSGRKRAKELISYHVISELLLSRVLKMKDPEEIDRIACDFEHHFTPVLKKKLVKFLGIEEEIRNIDNFIIEDRLPTHIETQPIYTAADLKPLLSSFQNQIINGLNQTSDAKDAKSIINKLFEEFSGLYLS